MVGRDEDSGREWEARYRRRRKKKENRSINADHCRNRWMLYILFVLHVYLLLARCSYIIYFAQVFVWFFFFWLVIANCFIIVVAVIHNTHIQHLHTCRITEFRSTFWNFRKSTSPATTSDGTTSNSRKKSLSKRAMSANEFRLCSDVAIQQNNNRHRWSQLSWYARMTFLYWRSIIIDEMGHALSFVDCEFKWMDKMCAHATQ